MDIYIKLNMKSLTSFIIESAKQISVLETFVNAIINAKGDKIALYILDSGATHDWYKDYENIMLLISKLNINVTVFGFSSSVYEIKSAKDFKHSGPHGSVNMLSDDLLLNRDKFNEFILISDEIDEKALPELVHDIKSELKAKISYHIVK